MDEKKVKEAINLLQIQICTLEEQKEYDEYGQPLYNETLDIAIEQYKTAIEALEKQLPKEAVKRSLVKDNGIVVGAVGRCPCCNEIIDYTMTVCDCGQKIDWSE